MPGAAPVAPTAADMEAAGQAVLPAHDPAPRVATPPAAPTAAPEYDGEILGKSLKVSTGLMTRFQMREYQLALAEKRKPREFSEVMRTLMEAFAAGAVTGKEAEQSLGK